MRYSILGLVGAVVLFVAPQAAHAEEIRLSCASSPTASPMHLVVNLSSSTVTIEGWGTYSATITPTEVTWNGPGRTLQRLSRESGQWKTHNDDGSVGVLQCKPSTAIF